jgi:hypothetical protein
MGDVDIARDCKPLPGFEDERVRERGESRKEKGKR